jgi:hypothetical protein
MSYLRYGHSLQWFNAESTEYVYPCETGQVEDYGSGYTHLPSLIEVVGRMVLYETKDFGYATKIVVALACKLGIKHKLRLNNYPYEEMEKSRGHDYRKEIKYWMRVFNNERSPRAVAHFPDDDISDFDHLLNFSEEELYELKL